MEEALRNRLWAFYEFSYPVYSGGIVKCKKCAREEWFTGNEIRENAKNGLLKIFSHSSACPFKQRIIDEFSSTKRKIISSGKYVFACDKETIKDIVAYAEAGGYMMSPEVAAQLRKILKR